MDAAGNLLVADEGEGRVRKITPGGGITTAAIGFKKPQGVAVDPSGLLYVADTENHQLIRVESDGRATSLLKPGQLSFPGAVLAAPDGAIYIADTGNHRIRRVTQAGLVTEIAGDGVKGFDGDGGAAVAAQLDTPRALALDREGNLYIADTGNNRVRKVTAEGIITTIASNLEFPRGIAVLRSGEVVVSEAYGHRLQMIAGEEARVIAGTGSPGFAGDTGPAPEALLQAPAGLVCDSLGNIYVADLANRRVRKLSGSFAPPPPAMTQVSVIHGASLREGPIAPGAIVSLYGSGIGPEKSVSAAPTLSGGLSTKAGDIEIHVHGTAAPILYASRDQINIQVPYTVAGQSEVEIVILRAGTAVARTVAPVAAAAPGIFTVAGGTGPAVALNEDGTVNSGRNPAQRGSIVTLYATGEGVTSPASETGLPAAAPFPKPALPVRLLVGGHSVEILYAGSAPGFAGLMQINARLPGGFAPAGEVPLVLTIGSVAAQSGVTLSVR
jgi:uncharacterized protein (TIGR03437 family)